MNGPTAAHQTTPGEPRIRGRALDRTLLFDTARTHLARGGGLLLTGPAGIGRTTLLARLADAHAGRGLPVLRCAPTPAGRDSPLLGLAELLADVGDDVLDTLPGHERALLDAALLRGPLPPGADLGGARELLVLRLAVRTVLTRVAAAGTLLLAIDDAQWLDPLTADVLAFAARRTTGSAWTTVAALRTEPIAYGDTPAVYGAHRPGRSGPAPHGDGPLNGGAPVNGSAVNGSTVNGHRTAVGVSLTAADRTAADPADRHPAAGDRTRTEAAAHDGQPETAAPAPATAARGFTGGTRPGALAVEALCPRPVRRIPVPPMTPYETSDLLDASGLPQWSRQVVARLHNTGGGNPRTVLELAHALAESTRVRSQLLPDPGEPLPVPESLRRPILNHLDALPPRARRTLLTTSAAVTPTIDLLHRAGCREAAADIDLGVRSGLLAAPADGSVRFLDPLTPLVLYSEAPYDLRVGVHRALAEATDDPVERAHHLALLTAGPDAEVAARLADAASAARRRGTPGTAARLGRMAAQHTPAADHAADIERRLTAAEDAVAAGDVDFARRLAREVLDEADDAADRVRAWNVVVDSCGQAMAEIDEVFPEALRDAGADPALLAQLHYRMSWREWMVGGSAERALGHAERSAGLAAGAGDRRTELLALTQQAALELFLGRPEAEFTLSRALAPPHDMRVMTDHNGPLYVKSRFHLACDRLDEARAELRALVYTLRQRGSAEGLAQSLIGLAQVEIQRGRCRQALSTARQALRITEQAGLSQGPAWYALALAETAGGSLDQALIAAESSCRYSMDDDDRLFLPRALHAEGRIRMFRGRPEAAVELLRRTAEMETAQGQRDPAMRRWHADFAEALARSGAADEAEDVIARARAQAERLGRFGVLASLDRSAALVAEARGDLAAAAAGLEDAARRFATVPYPLEVARTRLALGQVHRSRGDHTAARTAFSDALRLFTTTGARAWIAVARAERDRAEPESTAHRPYEGSWSEHLTTTERSVVTRVAQGASNREIAAGLVISVKTVEAALTRAYRKLGAKSRVDITRIVMAGPMG